MRGLTSLSRDLEGELLDGFHPLPTHRLWLGQARWPRLNARVDPGRLPVVPRLAGTLPVARLPTQSQAWAGGAADSSQNSNAPARGAAALGQPRCPECAAVVLVSGQSEPRWSEDLLRRRRPECAARQAGHAYLMSGFTAHPDFRRVSTIWLRYPG